MTKVLHYVSKPFLQLLLFALFLGFFGIPAIQRYQMMKVMVVSSSLDTGGIASPAITVVALNPETMNGWKGDGKSWQQDELEKRCKDDNIVDCIKSETFNISEFSKDVIIGWLTHKSISPREDLWMEDYGAPWFGRYHTLHTGRKLEPDDDKGQLFLLMSYSFVYEIFVHDPHFFILNDNPNGFPSNRLTLNPNTSGNNYQR